MADGDNSTRKFPLCTHTIQLSSCTAIHKMLLPLYSVLYYMVCSSNPPLAALFTIRPYS